jgi:DNA-binding NtrC family response regulator
VLILTGHGSIDLALEALKMGAYDYVTKPCEITELVSKIEEIGCERKTIKDKKGS